MAEDFSINVKVNIDDDERKHLSKLLVEATSHCFPVSNTLDAIATTLLELSKDDSYSTATRLLLLRLSYDAKAAWKDLNKTIGESSDILERLKSK